MKKSALLFLLFLSLSTSAHALVSLSLSENEIPLGKAVQLTVQADKEINTYPLANEISKKAKIRGQSSSTNIQITNNSQTNLYSVSFTIFPFAEGQVVFGPFDVNQEKTNQVTLNVLPAEKLTQQNNPQNVLSTPSSQPVSSVVFQADITPKKIYEGQTAIYKLSFFDPVTIYNLNIQTPRSNHFSLTKLNQDTVSQEKINERIGKLYQSYFALTPSSSGKYQINPAELSGAIQEKTNNRPNAIPDIFDIALNDRFLISPFQQQTPIYFQSNPIEIEINEKPKNWQGWWLPSEKVSLQQEFNLPKSIHLGEAIERKITLKVKNVDPSKLPTISHPSTTDYTFFANPEQRYPLFEKGEFFGVETQEFLIIPQKEGIIQLPPLSIKYFDTKSESEKIVEIEGKEITVLPAMVPIAKTIEETPISPQQAEEATQKSPLPQKKDKTPSHFIFIFPFAGILILLLCTFFLIKHKKKNRFKEIENIKDETKSKKKKKPLPDLYPF